MNTFVASFDDWIRSSFVEMNTELKQRYFAQDDRSGTQDIGDNIKSQLVEEGSGYIVDLLAEGNTNEGIDQAFNLLGNKSPYTVGRHRHEVTEALDILREFSNFQKNVCCD